MNYIKKLISIFDRKEKTPKKIWYAPNKFEAYGKEEIEAVKKCLEDGWLAGTGDPGSKVYEFEKIIAQYFGKKYGVFVNSGSSANLLALACLELKKGSEIITPACTFSTTVAPIVQLGLKPVFCDVDLKRYVPSIKQILECITPKTKVIMLPNLVGSKPNWLALKNELIILGRQDIVLLEDSCDTITYTKSSNISTTSFYSSHIITAGGTGGMVMFNDEKLYKKALMYRDWGRIGNNSEIMSERFDHKVDNIKYDHKFLYGVLGYNFKCSEMNAAFGLVQLNKLDKFESIRNNNFDRYLENLKDVKEIILPENFTWKESWLAIPLQTKDRLGLLDFLEQNNIQTRVCFAGNITRHPAYRKYFQPFKNSDRIMKNGFLLGCHHGMTIDDVDYVCNKIKEYFGYPYKNMSVISN